MTEWSVRWTTTISFSRWTGKFAGTRSSARSSSFSDDPMDIEKKLRVEDFRLLRHRFTRSPAHSLDPLVKRKEKMLTNPSSSLQTLFTEAFALSLVSLTKEELPEAVASIPDPSQYANQLEKLFDKVLETLLVLLLFLLVIIIIIIIERNL